MANIMIKGDPRMGAAIAEGANAVALKAAQAENDHLKAVNGVRAYGDSVRWQTVADALAVKYQVKQHGRLYEAILGGWACLWLALVSMSEYLTREV